MNILMGAQDFGFGPVSKLVALSHALKLHRRTFIGSGTSLQFAHTNLDAFDATLDAELLPNMTFRRLLANSDLVISVMHPDLVFCASLANVPTLFIDSLFGFWEVAGGDARLLRILEAGGPPELCKAGLSTLSVHEKMIAAHLIANRALIQNAPSVESRISGFPYSYRSGFRLTGPIIDSARIQALATESPAPIDAEGHGLLLNIGGFRNHFVGRGENEQYLRLIERWCEDIAKDWPCFGHITVCGGPYAAEEHNVGSTAVRYVLLTQPEFFRAVHHCNTYFMTPGLTSLNEAAALDVLPFALPEQHYGHVHNIQELRGTVFSSLACSFADCMDDYVLPDSDEGGTLSILHAINQVLSDDAIYLAFRRTMNAKIERFVGLSALEVKTGLEEVKAAFAGPDVVDLVRQYVTNG